MVTETFNVAAIKDGWRREVERTIRKISAEELTAHWERLSSDHSHPWSEPLRRLIDKNGESTFYHAMTIDQIQFIYSQAGEKGYWFLPGIAIGIMQTSALNAMKEIIKTRLA